ncbi:GrpB family protein [Croceicoccus marinus]|uniref:GrpB family protein n=1 Tax=Croceicoccus marinus TaxID=450378 RepID=A0A1Z1FAI7_9SPHN|nr:GrpB family protein [Croceicoccus marinus]ARU15736.1 hypothetical protein A9D14_05515 [Croceicoccus marinus]
MDANDVIFRLAPDHHRARADAEQLYRSVSQRLIRVLPTGSEIMHVGATAIADCLTKGDLAVMVRVDAEEFSEAELALASLFARGLSDRTEDFASFEDKNAVPPLGILLVAKGGTLDVFEKFRDRLSSSPALLREYNALKREHDGAEMESYRSAKDRFIVRTLRY